ncbi:Sterile alpha motif domain-containing protein 12 [Collichthys lucidus]|uniref:Sterile alpha motif domain-containing protein 12 n=1 Tax=Collichthys lucidus TaxID=240159 RepID=A0A4U5UD54_COLLU|nr:Sterile alpha motif domain-containing protein 12 [Collichthys lucidus]
MPVLLGPFVRCRSSATLLVFCIVFAGFTCTAVHCNLSQNGIDHQMCPEDVTSQVEEEEESVDAGAVLLDDDSPSYQDISPPMYQRRSPPHRSVSESELTRPGYVKLSKPVALWTQQDVCKWLKKHCPNQHQIYSDSFKQHDITEHPRCALLPLSATCSPATRPTRLSIPSHCQALPRTTVATSIISLTRLLKVTSALTTLRSA